MLDMNPRHIDWTALPQVHTGHRRHRYMESADINAAFRELFGPLRSSVRHGLTAPGNVYAMEMDPCIPGQLLATEWVPPVSHPELQPERLFDESVRGDVIARLLQRRDRPESLFAYVCEARDSRGAPVMLLEVWSEDAVFAALLPIRPGRGWRRRDLESRPHKRCERTSPSSH